MPRMNQHMYWPWSRNPPASGRPSSVSPLAAPKEDIASSNKRTEIKTTIEWI